MVLFQVSLRVSEDCGPNQPTLATTTVRVKVDLGINSIDGVHFGDEHHTYPEVASMKKDNV